MKHTFRRIVELGLMVLVTLGLFSFVDRDNSHYLASLKKITQVSVPPGKPGFKVDRRPLTSCVDMLQPVIEPDKGGLLRGVGFGMSKTNVKDIEQVQPLVDEDLKVIYTEAVNNSNGSTISAQLTYDFDHNKLLDMISVDYFADTDHTAELIFQEYLSYFNARFGAGQEDEDGYTYWDAVYHDATGTPMGYKLYLKNISKRDDAGVSVQYIVTDLSVVQR